MRVALLYEHPTWSLELLARLADRSVEVTAIDIGNPAHQPLIANSYDLWVNRINIMPSAGRPATVAATAQHLLLSLEARGERVFNGWRTHAIGASKIAQYELFTGLGLHTPTTSALVAGDAGPAADRLGFPVLTKPNIGGSGSGIARFEDRQALQGALDNGRLDLGVDGTGVVQEVIASADGFVHRVEILAGQLFYGTRQAVQDGVYNYCAADGCGVPLGDQPDQPNQTDQSGAPSTGTVAPAIEVVDPSPEIVADVCAIVSAAGAEVAGVEYLIDRDSGRACFYDFNPYSNFIAGQNDRLGFDPTDRFIDAVLAAATARAD